MLKKGWMNRQFDKAEEAVKRWPEWMRVPKLSENVELKDSKEKLLSYENLQSHHMNEKPEAENLEPL